VRGRDDVIIGIGATGATMAIGLAVVPIYVRILGIEAYGLVGFLALLQGSLQLLDMGLSPTISREVARAGATGTYDRAAALLRTLARLYIAVGIAIGVALWIASRQIADGWLQPDTMDIAVVATCVALMGAILACRWPVGIYTGALIGAHHVRTVSVLTFAFAMLSSVGGAVIILIIPRVDVLFVWQAVAAFLQLLMFRAATWRLLGASARGPFSFDALRAIWRFSAGMSVITVFAVILSQLDRAIVSKFVSLEAFGLYALANVIGRAIYGMINPVYNVIYPRFTVMFERGEEEQLANSYGEWTSLFCSFFLPASMAIVISGGPIVRLWTGDALIAQQIAPLIALISVGCALHGTMYFPFASQIASGDSRTPIIINAMLVFIYVPLLTILVLTKGIFGAALAWCVLFIVYIPLGTWISHRKMLRSVAVRWLFADVGIAFLISFAVGALTFLLRQLTPYNDWILVGSAVIAAMIAAIACFAITAFRYAATRGHLLLIVRRLRHS
jgi:O-antigen/teichoic acid export membrane protein